MNFSHDTIIILSYSWTIIVIMLLINSRYGSKKVTGVKGGDHYLYKSPYLTPPLFFFADCYRIEQH